MRLKRWWEVAVIVLMVGFFIASAKPVVTHTEPSPKPAPATQKIIALTFDDGPSPKFTPQILQLLTRYHAHATFFVLGSEATRFPKILKDIIKQGSVVANHGDQHVNFFHVGVSGTVRDAQKTATWLKKEHIAMAPFYRPPYGNSNAKLTHAINQQGWTLTLWSIDTRDWAEPGTSAITKKVLRDAAPGSIVLMHDSGGNRTETVQALAAILPVLTAQGYRFVTLPQYVKDLHITTPTKLPLPAALPGKDQQNPHQAAHEYL